MHLDPGVNRLGLNITSVHQTDRRPVTPDIVFPICVILWPQEHGLNKHSKTTGDQYILQITLTHAHMHPGSETPVLVPCLDSLERSQSEYKTEYQHMQMKEGESSFNRQVAFKVGTTPLGSTERRLKTAE